jgi:serine/threonine-protein kinase
VYAVGIMLYEMLSGLVPFTGSSLPLIIAAVMREVPLSLEQRGVDVSLALSSLVMRAMAREPSDRFPSARDMLAALEALAGDGTQQGAPACERESIVELPRRRHKLWLATGLTVAVAAATGLLFADERVEPSAAAQPSASAQPVAQERQTTGAPFAGAALAPQVRVPLSPLSLAPASGASSSALSPAEPAQPSVQPSEDAKTHHRHGREARREDEARRELEARESARERDDEARREREDEARRVEARGSAREQNEDESRRERQRAPDFADKALILPENPY